MVETMVLVGAQPGVILQPGREGVGLGFGYDGIAIPVPVERRYLQISKSIIGWGGSGDAGRREEPR